MANELRHESTAAGTSCAQTDWEDVDIHRFQGQAIGDIGYASTNVQIRRLAIGSTGQVLEVAGGVPTWAAKGFSSRARGYLNAAAQTIPNNAGVVVILDAESYDGDSELKVRLITGAADATEAFKLHDADGGFEAADVGGYIWNTTDNTYATITAFVDAGELTLNTDIMVNGENYKLYHSRFTATSAGYYAITAAMMFNSPVADKGYSILIAQNGSAESYIRVHASCLDAVNPVAADILYLAASDYVEMYAFQATGGTGDITSGSEFTYLSIHRLS